MQIMSTIWPNALERHYHLTRATDDLERAIPLNEESMKSIQNSGPDGLSRLNNLT